MRATPTLDEIAEEPGRVRDLGPALCGALVAKTATVLAALSARLAEQAEATLDPQADRLLTVREAAARLGCSPRTIWRMRDKAPYAALIRSNGTSRVRVSAAAIDEYLRRGLVRRSSSPSTGASVVGRPRVLSPPHARKGQG